MTTRYFRQLSTPSEQELYQSLNSEVIDIHGMDVYYVPRRQLNTDDVMVDDKLSEFYNAYPLTVYLKNVEGFGGQGAFVSQFGIEIRNQVTLAVSRTAFARDVAARDETFRYNTPYMGRAVQRPREGDLIYIPLNQKIYAIRYVDPEVQFYQLGQLLTFDLSCEQFNFNNELYDTGVPEIDAIFDAYNMNQQAPDNGPTDLLLSAAKDYFIMNASNTHAISYATEISPYSGDQQDKSLEVIEEANDYIDWSNVDPFGDNESIT